MSGIPIRIVRRHPRIRARWFEAHSALVALAGASTSFQATVGGGLDWGGVTPIGEQDHRSDHGGPYGDHDPTLGRPAARH